jgi:hypothetical protein
MLYRDVNGKVTEVTSTGQPLGSSLMLDSNREPFWGEGSDTIAVQNNSGADMDKGDIVRISGFDVGDNLPEVELAQADTGVNSRAVAMLGEDILDGAAGTAVVTGTIIGLNTAAAGVDGPPIYLDATTPGAWTTTRPNNPEVTVFIGWVRRASGGTTGSILVKVEGNARPMGLALGFGGDATVASVGDFLLAHGLATTALIGPNGGTPAFNSELIVPVGSDGTLQSVAWSTATGDGGGTPPERTDFTIWQNGVADQTVTLTAATAPQGSLDLPTPMAVVAGDALAVEWSGGTVNPGGLLVELYIQRT